MIRLYRGSYCVSEKYCRTNCTDYILNWLKLQLQIPRRNRSDEGTSHQSRAQNDECSENSFLWDGRSLWVLFRFSLPPNPISCARCWQGSQSWTFWPQDFSQFGLFVLFLCKYGITWSVKDCLLHKSTAKSSAYINWLIEQRKQRKKLPKLLQNLIYQHLLGSFPPIFRVLFSSHGTAASVPINFLRKWVIISNWLEGKWVRAKAYESNLLNVVKNSL